MSQSVVRFFLSHSTPDRPLVLRIHRALTTLGLSSWVDKFEIKAGDSLVEKVFDQGLQNSAYVCAFITNNSQDSRWVREELDFAFNRFLRDGEPKIIPLQFDNAHVPVFLYHRLYASLKRHELSDIIQTIMSAANLENLSAENNAMPYATLDFHESYRDGDITYFIASRLDSLDVEPFFDKEGVTFRQRHVFVLRWDNKRKYMKSHYLSKARFAHIAMRAIGENLFVFMNSKLLNHDFAMNGDIFCLKKDTLQAISVTSVFERKNWGWSPWIDENSSVHHGDSETAGNPYLIGTFPVLGKNWNDLAKIVEKWRLKTSGYAVLDKPGRETGYVGFIDVDPLPFNGN